MVVYATNSVSLYTFFLTLWNGTAFLDVFVAFRHLRFAVSVHTMRQPLVLPNEVDVEMSKNVFH